MDFTGRGLRVAELKNQVADLIDNMVEKVVVRAASHEGFINGLFATITTTENAVQRTYKTPLIVDGSRGIAYCYVKRGVAYSVSVEAYGETSPVSQSFTSDRTARDVDFFYDCDMAPLGVWCEATDGSLIAAADWATEGQGKTAQSVVVVTAEHQFRVGLTNVEQGTCAWGGRGTDIETLPDLYQKDAINDFDSKGNTDKILARLNPGWNGEALTDYYTSGHIDEYTVSYTGDLATKGAPAAEACRRYSSGTIGAGKWDLPAFGIMYLIYINKAAINACLTAMGGTALANDANWTSTEFSGTYTWYINLNYGYQYNFNKFLANYVRAVSAF